MTKLKLAVVFVLNLLVFKAISQPYPQNFFRWPLDSEIVFSGSFAEIRPDHFHSGVDLSTNEMEGKSVLAAADGYVSRIKVSSGGFGKAIYITHNNGYVTVYGHLQKFNDAIQSYVVKNQMKEERFEIELFPLPNQFVFKQGDVIAISGNSGSSGGPHLHFEIRDQKNEHPLNPLLFGLKANDELPPVFKSVRIFPIANQGTLETGNFAYNYKTYYDSGMYKVISDGYIEAFGKVGIGVEVNDFQFPMSKNDLGIYQLQIFVDNILKYEFKFDEFSFDDTRMVNAHIDYESKVDFKRTVQRCYKLPGNHLPFYNDTANSNGYIDFLDDDYHSVLIEAIDFNGNKSLVEFTVLSNSFLAGKEFQMPEDDAVLITSGKGIAIHKLGLDVVVPAGAVYDATYFKTQENVALSQTLSKVYTVGDRGVAVNGIITVGIKPTLLNLQYANKYCLVRIESGNKLTYCNSNLQGDMVTAKVKRFGDYAVSADTITPKIVMISQPSNENMSGLFKIKMDDNLSGIKDYKATVNGKFCLMEYDAKNDLLFCAPSEVLKGKKNAFKLVATDNCGNETVFEKEFLNQ